jgi:WS/DGAT/MGAT family acyltransferase
MTDRMSPIDASFIYAEDDGLNHMHIASVLILEGPPPSYDELLNMVRSKIPDLPRYRQTMKEVPLHLGRPIWVDDAHFDLRYHVRESALAAPGTEEQRWRLFARIMSQRLDRTRPLWELWSVEGLDDDRWLLISKVHHAMVDGVAGTELITNLLDRSPDPQRRTEPRWTTQPAPSSTAMVVDAVSEMVTGAFRGLPGLLAKLRPTTEPKALRTDLDHARRLVTARTAETLNGPVGPNRRYVTTKVTIAEVKQIRTKIGGTLNDVVLAAATNGYRELISGRGEPLDGRVVRVMVPVALHERDARGMAIHASDGTYENKATAVVVDLPVSVDDPLERARLVREQMEHIKSSDQIATMSALADTAAYAPATLMAVGMRAAAALPPQTTVNSVVSNVPGPRMTLYAAGRRLIEAYPCPPLWPVGAQVATALWSYDGTLHFGILGDYSTTEDLPVLAHGIRQGIDDLLGLTGRMPDLPAR